MVELTERTPLAGLATRVVGTTTLREVNLGTLTNIAPFRGRCDAAAVVLKDAHGLAWPGPGRSSGKEGARVIWFGRDCVLLAGPEPDARLAEHAAVTDQSDAWTTLLLTGAGAEQVLARLVPLDLDRSEFKRGHTARTLIQHLNGSVTRIGADGFLLMVFRSMAGTLLHDLERAMESIAARG